MFVKWGIGGIIDLNSGYSYIIDKEFKRDTFFYEKTLNKKEL